MSTLSASGVPLSGKRLVRVTYMDESGSSPSDPLIVQAAIIAHGDGQVIAVEDHLESLIDKHIPEQHRHDFVFHSS